jgi:hypothetical protein
MKTLIVSLVCLLLATGVAGAGTGLTPDLLGAGGSVDFLKGNGFDTQLEQLQIQYAYAFPLDSRSTVLTAHRILAGPGDGAEPSAFVNEFSAIYAYDMQSGFNFFVGPVFTLLGTEFTGKREELYGGIGGFSFPLEDQARMVVAYRYSAGEENLRGRGLVFGPVFDIGR